MKDDKSPKNNNNKKNQSKSDCPSKCTKEDADQSKAPGSGCNMDSNSASLNSLVVWNISKAREKNPCINLQSELEKIKKRLESRAFRDIAELANLTPLERHLVCALLAWQTLGKSDVASLIKFIDLHNKAKNEACKPSVSSCMGPVIKLPSDPMKPCSPERRKMSDPSNVMKKIDAACSLDSECAMRLEEATKQTSELQERTRRLSEREAHRVELLERAELAWHNLELGFLRKLQLAQDKEHLLNKKLKETIEEHGKCAENLAKLESERSEKEKKLEREKIATEEAERSLCALACNRHRLEEECSKKAAAQSEQQCRLLKAERDMIFKEDLSKNRVDTLRSDLDSARLLTVEAERVIYNELLDIKNQTDMISAELLALDARNREDSDQLDSLEREKMGLEADVLDCRARCDSHMEGEMDKLRALREEMNSLRERVLECRCKLPVDAAVEVKRTPSLVVTCDCPQEATDEITECSCTSLRHKLLSDLLSDLFGGLQEDLMRNGSVMPCEILKCLDDKHNWERNSPIKVKLRTYFSNLLLGELDIAIATAIEKYHAKWIGACCKDFMKNTDDCGCKCSEKQSEDLSVEKVVERRALEIIEKIFLEQANKYMNCSKMTNTPVVESPNKFNDKNKKIFLCQTQKQKGIFSNPEKPDIMRRTNDFGAQIQLHVEDFNRMKSTLKNMDINEKNYVRKLRQGPNLEITNPESKRKAKDIYNKPKLKSSTHKLNFFNNRQNSMKKKLVTDPILAKKKYNLYGQTKTSNSQKNKSCATYSVHMCYAMTREDVPPESIPKETCLCDAKQKDGVSIKQSKHSSTSRFPLLNVVHKSETLNSKSAFEEPCHCLNKTPSNSSLIKLFKALAKWKNGTKNNADAKTTQRHPENCTIRKNIDTQYEDFTSEIKKKNSTNSFETATEMNEVSNNRVHKECQQTISGFNRAKVIEIKREKCQRSVTVVKSPINGTELEDVRTADSEYMGEINLDKSNETQCICEHRRENVMQGSCTKYGFKCINSNICNCKYDTSEKKPTIFSDIDKYLETRKPIDDAINAEEQEKNVTKISKHTSAIEQKMIDQKQQQQQTVEDIIKKTVLFPHNCDYDINFLGATLTNEKHSKSLKTSFKKYSKSNDLSRSESKSSSDLKTNFHKKYSSKSTEIKNDFPGVTSIDNRFEDLKKYFYNIFTKCGKKQNTNEDKALDVPSVRTMIARQRSTNVCICCNTNDEADLEINAFELLREHLKCKLQDLKKSPTKLENIPKEEEEMLFSCILQKVREVISESTHIACKCEGKVNINNCSRAYELLKAYLEAKLRRAKCQCFTKSSGEVKYNVPELLDKVSTLIENDFELLKLNKFKREDYDRTFEIPEKDINEEEFSRRQSISEKNTEKRVNDMANETDHFDYNNTSCQVSRINVEMKSKSCAALDFNDGMHEIENGENTLYYNVMKEIRENKSINPELKDKENDLLWKNNYDYSIQNTDKRCNIQCLCDTTLTNGQCFCIKSLLKENYGNIKSLDCKPNKVNDTDKYNTLAKPIDNYSKSNYITSDSLEIESNEKYNEIKNSIAIQSNNVKIRLEHAGILSQSANSENTKTSAKEIPDESNTSYLNCDCELVPVCHVKMLVDNIENKLAQSKCMCDLFCAKFCPVHLKKT